MDQFARLTAFQGTTSNSRRRLHRLGVGPRRRLVSILLGVVLLPATTLALHPGGAIVSLPTILLTYLLIAVLVAFVGGALPGILAAVAGFLSANWFFTSPIRTWTVDDPENLLGLLVFLAVASAVGLLVGVARRRAEDAQRARAQVEALATTVSSFDIVQGFEPLVFKIRSVFDAQTVAVLERRNGDWTIGACAGGPPPLDPFTVDEIVEIDTDRVLVLDGARLAPGDHRVLSAFAARVNDALTRELLRQEAARVEAMAETDRLRTALLGAVSHDLRTPIASIKASVTSLTETDIAWTPEQTLSFLETIRTETERLNRLVGQLLDAGRIQVGAVQVDRRPTVPDEVVAAAIASLSNETNRLILDVGESLPLIDTDPVLFERVLANLIENALNYSSGTVPVTVRANLRQDEMVFEVVDRGPGVPPSATETVFRPFQRLSDARTTTGVGLGLAVTKGFLDALCTSLFIDETPGGGATFRISIPLWENGGR